jgi:hypothetical protein
VLLIFAAVMLDLMEGMFELAGFERIELGFGFADITDQDLEVGRLGVALDKGGKTEFLDWHRVPPAASIAKLQSSVRNSWKTAAKGSGKQIVKNRIHRLGMACHGPRRTPIHPGRGTPLIGQRECGVYFGPRRDQRKLVF